MSQCICAGQGAIAFYFFDLVVGRSGNFRNQRNAATNAPASPTLVAEMRMLRILPGCLRAELRTPAPVNAS